jgi:hypothetical protein
MSEKVIILEPNDERVKEMVMLYYESYPWNDGYFSNNWSDFFDWWFRDVEGDPDEERPEYVQGTHRIQIHIDAAKITEWACEDLDEDDPYNIPQSEIAKLQEFLDDWCRRQGKTNTYLWDSNCEVRIPWEE